MTGNDALAMPTDGGDTLDCRVEGLDLSVFVIPTEAPESDATLEWDHTVLVVVEIRAGGCTGLGYTYAHEATAVVIRKLLSPLVVGRRVRDHPACWEAMVKAVRNVGLAGVAATGISAIDTALWDLRARLLGRPLVDLLGRVREAVPVYGSGGFTSYGERELVEQLAGWAEAGLPAVKMKVGREPDKDLDRVRAVRRAIGPEMALFVDGNNGYGRRQAVEVAWRFAEAGGVTWFEQPVSDEDIPGMRFVREHSPAAMEVADGEYGYTPAWFYARLEAEAADVLMPDITRCLGLTGFLRIAALCEAAHLPVSSHCAPALHAAAGCIVPNLRHCEYFHDHARIEQKVFEGAPTPDAHGLMRLEGDRPGFGLEFKSGEAARMAARSDQGMKR
jgi:L-alanine-DL-glutamate epimerase-like enolase superfamily enzyme